MILLQYFCLDSGLCLSRVTLSLLSPCLSSVWLFIPRPALFPAENRGERARYYSVGKGCLSAHRSRNFEVCDVLCCLGHVKGVGFVRFCLWFLLIHAGLRGRVGKLRFMSHLFLGSPSLVLLFFMTPSFDWMGS